MEKILRLYREIFIGFHSDHGPGKKTDMKWNPTLMSWDCSPDRRTA
jgi:hypothetical protein